MSRFEECRFALGGDQWGLGQWDFPRGTPPFPLAVLVAAPDAFNRDGEIPLRPGYRPLRDLVRALTDRGVATFRASPGPGGDGPARTWRRAVDHAMVSRQRIAVIAVGPDASDAITACWPALTRARPPLLWVRCWPGERPPPPLGFATLISIRGGPADPRVPHSDRETVLTIPDLTPSLQRHEDWLRGRPVTHPELLTTLADAVSTALRPRWERSPARPPGTAIGQSVSDGPSAAP